MTAVDDALTPSGGTAVLTYEETDRKVTLAFLDNIDGNAGKTGKYERTLTA